MQYDYAIVYFGLTRSVKKIYESHIKNVFHSLEKNGLTYKKFMHTWKTNDNKQNVRGRLIDEDIDYDEYKLLDPDVYKIESQDDFLSNLDMNKFFYQNVFNTVGHRINGEWLPHLIKNHLCALESQKRSLELVENFVNDGNTFRFVMFLRPDVFINNELPLCKILVDHINIPDYNHNEGYNDRFAIIDYKAAHLYGKRINEIEEFRKTQGRIVSEKYVKFIINKYNLKVNRIDFRFDITRASSKILPELLVPSRTEHRVPSDISR